jgi:predicted DNA-binding antitoxin AbrB/MazE fold protein
MEDLAMQGLQIDAIYENGVLKLPRELPVVAGATVTITIHPPKRPNVIKHVQAPWTGKREDLERLAMEPEFGLEELP